MSGGKGRRAGLKIPSEIIWSRFKSEDTHKKKNLLFFFKLKKNLTLKNGDISTISKKV